MVTGHECSEEERPGDPSQDEILSLADSSPCMLRVLGGVPAKLSDLDIRSSRRVTAAYVFVVEEEVGGGAGRQRASTTKRFPSRRSWFGGVEREQEVPGGHLVVYLPRYLRQAERIAGRVKVGAGSTTGSAAAATQIRMRRIFLVPVTCSWSECNTPLR